MQNGSYTTKKIDNDDCTVFYGTSYKMNNISNSLPHLLV